MADDTTASQKQLADAKKDAYGDKPALDAKGEPLEKGVGSAYARLSLAGKAHLFAAEAYAAADAVVAAAKHLAEAGLKLAEHNKRAVDAAAACKAEPVAVAAALSNDERAELEALRKANPNPVTGETDTQRNARIAREGAEIKRQAALESQRAQQNQNYPAV